MLDFQVREGRMAAGTPVDEAVGPVDQAIFIERDENLPHGP